MGFRFGKRITLLPGVRLNVSGSGLGLSLGPRGASLSLNRNGVYGNVGLPGTGLSYRTKLSGNSKQASRSQGRAPEPGPVGIITIAITSDGSLSFTDEAGTELTPAQAKLFKAANAEQIDRLLERAAAATNQDLDACLYIHQHTTPLGSQIPIPAEFDGTNKPQMPEPVKVGLLDGMLGRRAKIEAENAERDEAYRRALIDWQTEWVEYNESRNSIIKAMTLVPSNHIRSMEIVADYLLNRITWPRETNISFGITECGRVVGIDLDLPDEDEVPSVSASAGRDKLVIKKRSDAQMRRDFVTLAYGSIFRVAGELFAGLPTVQKVVISSYVQRNCQATGHIQDEYVISTIIDRDGWSQINFNQLSDIDPEAAIGMFQVRVKPDRSSRFQEITPFELTDSYP